jgi:transposase-like protein
MTISRRYSPEVRERAVRLVLDHERDHDTERLAEAGIEPSVGSRGDS